ncbi:MAG: hypothetical protein WC787_03870 [Patescibacteria group bacterium]|jgi:hypothetical protein
MKDRICQSAKIGNIVPLIIHPEDTIELTSFVQDVNDSVDKRRDVTFVRTESDPSKDLAVGLFSHPHVVVLNCAQAKGELLEILGDDMNRTPRVRILHFRFERELAVIQKWPASLVRSVRHKPEIWPALSERKADIPGIIDAVCASFRARGNNRTVTLTKDAREFLTAKPGDRVTHISSRIRKAFAMACKDRRYIVSVRDLEAIDRPDVRQKLRDSQPPAP